MNKEQREHLSKVKQRKIQFQVNKNGCHVCTSHKPNSAGYPQFTRMGKVRNIHRVVYEENYGKINNKELFVCHTCDNKLCINIEHLFLGSQKDNMQDMVSKGKQRKNFDLANTKLSQEQVKQIKNSKENYKVLSGLFKIHPHYVHEIRSGKKRKHIYEGERK